MSCRKWVLVCVPVLAIAMAWLSVVVWNDINECRDIGDVCVGLSLEGISEKWGKASSISEVDMDRVPPNGRWMSFDRHLVGHAGERRVLEAVWGGMLSDRMVWFVRKNGTWVAVEGLRVGCMVML